jgi:UDP-2-acetamido-2,6-beta-L-arabino-hexul-4-ose reductase
MEEKFLGEKFLDVKEDARGILVEPFKIPGVGQVIYTTSKPSVTRGNHYHHRKREWFCIIKGECLFRARNRETGEIKELRVSGTKPQIIEVTGGWTHNFKNVGNDEMIFLGLVNEIFNPEDPDTFPEEV